MNNITCLKSQRVNYIVINLLGLTFGQFINRKQGLHKELLNTVWVTSQAKRYRCIH